MEYIFFAFIILLLWGNLSRKSKSHPLNSVSVAGQLPFSGCNKLSSAGDSFTSGCAIAAGVPEPGAPISPIRFVQQSTANGVPNPAGQIFKVESNGSITPISYQHFLSLGGRGALPGISLAGYKINRSPDPNQYCSVPAQTVPLHVTLPIDPPPIAIQRPVVAPRPPVRIVQRNVIPSQPPSIASAFCGAGSFALGGSGCGGGGSIGGYSGGAKEEVY